MTIDEIYLSETIKEAQVGLKAQEDAIGAVVILAAPLAGVERVGGILEKECASLRGEPRSGKL